MVAVEPLDWEMNVDYSHYDTIISNFYSECMAEPVDDRYDFYNNFVDLDTLEDNFWCDLVAEVATTSRAEYEYNFCLQLEGINREIHYWQVKYALESNSYWCLSLVSFSELPEDLVEEKINFCLSEIPIIEQEEYFNEIHTMIQVENSFYCHESSAIAPDS
jgi:hypothetical protein